VKDPPSSPLSSESQPSERLQLRYVPWSYRHAEEVLNSMLKLRTEIQESITAIRLPPEGLSRPQMNKELEKQLVGRGWQGQPRVAGDREDIEIEAKLDFLKGRAGIEVEFGHSSNIGIDLLKFQTMSYSALDKIDVGIYIMALGAFKRRMEERGQTWEGSLSYEKVLRYLPMFKSAIQVPIFVLGIDE